MKFVLLIIISIFSFTILSAQTKDSVSVKSDTAKIVKQTPQPAPSTRRDTRPLKDRIAFGFGTGFWVNANQTYIEVAPVVAYRFPKALITGIGYKYIYRHEHLYGVDLNSWGPNVFARLQLLKKVYMWTEYEFLNTQYLAQVAGLETNDKIKTSTTSLFAGLGYTKSLGKKGRGGLSFQVLYNFLYEREDVSPYYSPVTYRVGYYF